MKAWSQKHVIRGVMMKGMRFGMILFLFLSLLPAMGRTASMDEPLDAYTYGNFNFIYKGHDFSNGRRRYFFDLRYDIIPPKSHSEFPRHFRNSGTVTWYPDSKELSLDFEGKLYVVYKCGDRDMDPLLSKYPPSECKEIGFQYNSFYDTDRAISYYLKQGHKVIEYLRKGMSSDLRSLLIRNILEKSMHCETDSRIHTPPGGAVISLTYPKDIPIPKEMTVQFFVKGKYHTSIRNYYGEKIKFPLTRKLRGGGKTFCVVKALPPGEYIAYARMFLPYIAYSNEAHFVVEGLSGKASGSSQCRIVMPREDQTTGSTPIFRVLWDLKPGSPDALAVQIEYRVDYESGDYKLLRKETVSKKRWHYDKAAHTFGKWVDLLPYDADYRVRVAPKDKAYSQGHPKWGPWRHFRARLGRNLEIVKPTGTEPYTTKTIPYMIKLPSTITKRTSLTLRWYWFEGKNAFPTLILKQVAMVKPGSYAYSGSISASKLYKLVEEKDRYYPDGYFRLNVDINPNGRNLYDMQEFRVAWLAPPASEDQNQKKNLIHPMTFPGPTVLPFKLRYRSQEEIGIRLKTTATKPPAFQMRFRPAAGGSYTLLRRVPHRFSRLGVITTLHLKFKEPGRYQIRFREGDHGAWGSWHTFEVAGTTLTGAKKMKPGHPSPSAVHLAPPEIMSPRSRQAFMLVGREIQVPARLRHASGMKVSLEVQVKHHGRFTAIHPKLGLREGKTETVVTMRLTKVGTYRLRARQATASNAPWSSWREFRVDRPAKKLIHKVKPSSPTKGMRLNPSGITVK